MKPELKERWIAALEGEYADKKGKGFLCDDTGGLCCLGVLAEIEGVLSQKEDLRWCEENEVERRYIVLGEDEYCNEVYSCINFGSADIFGLHKMHRTELVKLNDNSDTFAPVIEYIRENV